MVHIKEAEEVQHLKEAGPISLNVVRSAGILGDYRADNGEDGNQDEKKNGELDGTEKLKQDGKKSLLFFFRRLHLWSYLRRILSAARTGQPWIDDMVQGWEVLENI